MSTPKDTFLPSVRCTEEERAKIARLSAWEDRTYADLLREMSITEMIERHDRIMARARDADGERFQA